jgi:hypothetical protein
MASGRVSKVKGKILDIPTAPTIGTAADGITGGIATVAFTASTKGGPAFSFRAVSNPGSIVGTGTTSPITVSGLTNDTAYTFTVAGVNPSGTSEYSAASNSATPTVPPTAFHSIATVSVGSGGQSSISFTSIPTNYKHLQLRMLLKADATTNGTPTLVYNSDTSSVYTYHHLKGDGSSATAYSPGANYGGTWFINGGQNSSGFGAYITDILDYTSTVKNKVIRTLGGFDNNGSGSIFLVSQAYQNTNTPITSLILTMQSGNVSQYSHVALYGIKD